MVPASKIMQKQLFHRYEMNILIVAAYTPEEKTNMHCEAAELLTCDMLDKVHHQAHLQLIPFRPNTTIYVPAHEGNSTFRAQ